MCCRNRLFKLITIGIFTLQFAACSQVEVKQAPATEAEIQALEKRQEAEAFSKAVKLHSEGEYEDASAAYKAVIERFPNNSAAHINLAQIEFNSGRVDEAFRYVQAALEITPTSPQALTMAGVYYRNKGQFDDAETAYRNALEADKNYLPAMLNLAILLDLYRGRLKEALELYVQVQEISSEPDPRLKDWVFDIKRRIGES